MHGWHWLHFVTDTLKQQRVLFFLLFVLVVIGFNRTMYSVREDAGSVTVNVSVISGAISEDVIITLSTPPGGTATGIYLLVTDNFPLHLCRSQLRSH